MSAASSTTPVLLPVFNALPGANLLLSPDLRIVGASDDYLAATLTQRATIVGQFIFDAFPDNPNTPEANGVANVRASLEQVLATKQPHEMALQHYDVPDPARPGQFVERHWLPRHTPVLDADGQVQFIIQSVQDVTARRLAERQLRESQASEQLARADAEQQRAKFQYFIEQAPVAVAVYRGPEYRVEMANATTLAIWDRPLGAVLHRPVFEVMPEAATPEVVTLFDQVYTTGTSRTVYEQPTTIYLRGRQEVVYWNFVFEPQRDADGHVSGIFTVGTDVSAQVRARQQVEQLNQALEAHVQERTATLLANEARFRHVVEQAPVAIALTRGDDVVIESINTSMLSIMGKATPEEVLGKAMVEVLPHIESQAILHIARTVTETGQSFRGNEVPIYMQMGGELELRYFNVSYTPLRDGHAAPGLIHLAIDVTEQVRARQRTEALQGELLASAERRAEERETFYRVFEQTPAAIVLLRGPEHRVEYHNAAYQQLFPGRQMRGRTIAEMQPDAAEQGFVALLDSVYQTGETFVGRELQLNIDQPDGRRQETYFNFTYQAFRENGQIAGISVFAYDVTEQVLARQEREAQQRRFYTLFEQAPIGIAIQVGPELVYEFVNPGYQRMVPDRRLLGRPFLDVFPEMAGTQVETLLQQVFETGQTQHAQDLLIPVARADGSPELEERYFTLVYQPRHDALGQVDGVLAFVFEVTEQVRAREQVERSRETLALALDAVQMGSWHLDLRTDTTVRSLQHDRIFGYDALLPDWGYDRFMTHVLPDDQPAVAAAFQQAGTTGALRFEARIHRTDGVLRWIEVRGSVFYDEARQPLRMAGVVLNITERRAAQQQFEHLTQQLAEANAELLGTNQELQQSNTQLTRTNVDLDNFIYTASHDLKAPISNIEGLLHALREQLPPTAQQMEPVGPILHMMQSAVDRFKQTINHLTDISKLQQEHTQPTEQVDLAAVVENVRLDLLPLLKETGAHLEVALVDCPAIAFSAKNLRSVVYNLLSNALKYRHPDRVPQIQVTCQQAEGTLLLRVADNGLGLNEVQQAKLFGMFRRLHTHVEGSGIGLYIVKKMVENVGGKIEVKSELGAGSTFIVSFPA